MDYLLNLNVDWEQAMMCDVLNLIINGLPSKRIGSEVLKEADNLCFKPYYKWITF